MKKPFGFTLQAKDPKSRARAGVIHTPHGDIETPAFVPVGTQASVKSITPDELTDLGVQLFFVNTYHAYLRPGLSVIKKFGGLHRFMHWDKPLITDSGGFQVFSLGKKRYVNIAISESAVLDREKFTKKRSKKEAKKDHVYPDDYRPVGELVNIDEDGVTFTSHWDGTTHRFTPERSIEIQKILGADLTIAFDECAPYPTTHAYAHKAMERTHRWAARSLTQHKVLSSQLLDDRKTKNKEQITKNNYQALYGVVQGSVFEDLRQESARVISAMDFDGIAIGGVSVGESKVEMAQVLDWTVPLLPDHKPRHLLGVGELDDMFTLVERGMDTFDCVQPTRLARMGHVFVKGSDPWTIDIQKTVYAEDMLPIDPSCCCYTCTHFSRAYIHHLFRVKELLAYRLTTIHNIFMMQSIIRIIRQSILDGTFLEIKNLWLYNR